MAFRHFLLLGCALWAGLALGAPPAGPGSGSGKLYRWVDSQGRVHYGDTLPPSAGVSGSAELGRTGQVMKRSESMVERKARLQAEAEAARIKREKDERNRLDQALLGTYTSEKEIDLARDRALEFHQMAIKSAQTRIGQVEINQKDVNTQADAIIKRGKPVPRFLQKQIAASQAELDGLNRLIKSNQDALVEVRQKYDADKARYRELTGQ